MKTLAWTAALIVGLSVTACTTNGASIGTTEVNVNSGVSQFPVETVFLNIYAKAWNETLYGEFEEVPVALVFETIPKGSMMFNGQRVQGSATIGTTKILDKNVDRSEGINYFTLNPLVFRGFTSEDEYSIATQNATIPKMARIGDSSTFLTENVYSDSTKREKINAYTQTWSLKPASKNMAWMCIESSENKLLAHDPDGITEECYKINAKGDILDSQIKNTYTTDEGVQVMTFISKQ